ncbi:metal/formaldehyde-sensitive transcriptional repressor [Phenylobacterium sp. LjRoot219]|uniref:metal/formaldehyde-sensitive transcriptional repressor n=1 Tax=Phenylobacterium sp. LjRoot219 TaxID=3342283 RepID=UPI003ECD1C65
MAHLNSQPELIARVRRLTGQLAAVERALTNGGDCASVLQQVAAIRGAVNGLMEEILETHLREHVAAPDLTPAARAQGADDVIAAIRRYAK